ncbi:hypothetical protein AB0G32_07275 [Streptomyces sp. NPDC023723]|uniref:hypothetical protein n=1 Tax=Streptomyces sp. NPDC023723 TaxID=3154323 RepID=UPI0033D840FA
MNLPFDGDGRKGPLGADYITGRTAETALRLLDTLGREAGHGLDMTERLPAVVELDKVIALRQEWSGSPRHRPPADVPRPEQHWQAWAEQAMRRIVRAVEDALREAGEAGGQPIAVLGADGGLDERTTAFRDHVHARRPVVSVSASGSIRRWLTTRDPTSVSLSVLTYIPGRPLYAAVVTPTAALLSDCSGSWHLTLGTGWQAMTGEPSYPDPDPQYIVLPRTLEHLSARLRRFYREPLFPYDTSSAIAQAVLSGAVPVAVHFTGPVLDAAILPVAIGYGLIVSLPDSGELLEKPWEASKHLYKAVTGEISFGADLVIARDLWAARRISSVLRRETARLAQADPIDLIATAETDLDATLFGFSPDRDDEV